MPRYAANIEGGGGKVLLMPSGHDTLNSANPIDEKIAESFATVSTWDSKKIFKYESLGRSSQKEYLESVDIMDKFIGRKGVFLPKVIIVNEKGEHLETTNRTKLPSFEKIRKSELLGYAIGSGDKPVTNPALIKDELERIFLLSNYNK
jgi:lysine 2,3-aminomutase